MFFCCCSCFGSQTDECARVQMCCEMCHVFIGRMRGGGGSSETTQATGSHWRLFSTQRAQSAAVRVWKLYGLSVINNQTRFSFHNKLNSCIVFTQLLSFILQDISQRTATLLLGCSTHFCLKRTTTSHSSSRAQQSHHRRTPTKRRRKRR